MKTNSEWFADATMILGGLSYLAASTLYLVSKLTASYSLNLM